MSKRLKENVSSAYIEAANRLKPKTARRRIVAYVESYDDVFFWRSVFSQFEDETRYFEVMLPARTPLMQGEDSRQTMYLERGKKAVLMKLLSQQVGQGMIACVDADYDYLMQGVTPSSQAVLSNPYVLHTYAYSIENLQCYAPSLHDVCVAVSLNDHAVFDFTEYLRQFSQAVFPLFVWSVWAYRTPHYRDFTITDFLRVIETGNFTIVGAEALLQNLRRKVGRRVEQLQHEYPDAKEAYQAVKEDIKRLGVTPDTTYLYIQGHHIFDKVVMPMLKKVCDQLVREREGEISRQSLHATQRRNELSCYTSSVGNIDYLLKKNVGYVHSNPFRRILADVERLLDEQFTEPVA